jgi:hypothetical protein
MQMRHVTSPLGHLHLANVAAIGKSRSEDLVDTVGSVAWLLDGAGARGDPNACRQHDASWFVCQLSQALAREFRESAGRDLRDVLAISIERVGSQHARLCPQIATGHGPSATVGDCASSRPQARVSRSGRQHTARANRRRRGRASQRYPSQRDRLACPRRY